MDLLKAWYLLERHSMIDQRRIKTIFLIWRRQKCGRLSPPSLLEPPSSCSCTNLVTLIGFVPFRLSCVYVKQIIRSFIFIVCFMGIGVGTEYPARSLKTEDEPDGNHAREGKYDIVVCRFMKRQISGQTSYHSGRQANEGTEVGTKKLKKEHNPCSVPANQGQTAN